VQIQKETAHPAKNAPIIQKTSYEPIPSSNGVKQIVVSLFKGARDTQPLDVTFGRVLTAMSTGKTKDNLRGQIEQIRDKHRYGDENAKKLAQELKQQLPAVTFSGTFTKRKNNALVQHSGLLCADIDALDGELPAVKSKLAQSPYVASVFLSPSGNGLKVIVRVPADISKHRASFRAVEKHIRQFIGVQIDQSGKDPARLCFLSYDPDIYVNENAIEIETLPEPEKPRHADNRMVNLSERQRITTELLGTVDWESDATGYVTCPGMACHTNPNGKRDCVIYLDGAPTVHCVHNSCRGILDGVNHELRSRIGKVEYAPDSATSSTPETSSRIAPSDEDAVELAPAPAPYAAPPLALFSVKLQDYIHAAAESVNVDVSYVLLPLLSALSSAIGNARSILLKRGFIQPAIIWTGIIGRSGGRKSPALEAGCFAVMEHERELVRQNKQADTEHVEAMAEWESRGRKERGPKPEPRPSLTCLMDDMTLEALADAIQQNPRGVLVKKDELSHWLSSFDQYHAARGADVSRWLSLHTGVFFGVDRRTDHRRYRIHQPRVCITGGIQPKVLRRALTEDFFERGLPARFLFAHPPMRQDKWSEATVSDDLRATVSELFQELLLLQPDLDDHDQQCPKLLAWTRTQRLNSSATTTRPGPPP
jgi:hypothetical protein